MLGCSILYLTILYPEGFRGRQMQIIECPGWRALILVSRHTSVHVLVIEPLFLHEIDFQIVQI
jgi:hypothetical protein